MPVPGQSAPTGDRHERRGVFGRSAEDEVIGAAAAALVHMRLANLRELPTAHIANELLRAARHAGLSDVAETLADLSRAGELRRVRETVDALVDSLTETITRGTTAPAGQRRGTDRTGDEVLGRVRARCLRWIDLTEQGHGAVEYASAAAHVLADLLGIEQDSDWSSCSPRCATGHRFDNGCTYRSQLASADERASRERGETGMRKELPS